MSETEKKSYGIQETKDALAFAMAMHMAYDKAAADGKINWADAVHLIEPGRKLPAMVQGIANVPHEMKDMTDAEKAELISWAKSEYDLADDKVEDMVEKGLALAVHVAQFVGALV